MIQVIQAFKSHVDQLVPLFDQYRIFYGQSSDPSGAKAFLQERFDLKESIVFLALENDMAIGFVQLYPMFSSVSMQRTFVLNDLFVHASHRGKNIGTLLLERAKAHCMEKGAKGLALETATDNPAQKLYEKLGWEKDVACFHYFWNNL